MKGGYLRNIFETSSTINVTLSHTLTSQEFWEVGRNNSKKKKGNKTTDYSRGNGGRGRGRKRRSGGGGGGSDGSGGGSGGEREEFGTGKVSSISSIKKEGEPNPHNNKRAEQSESAIPTEEQLRRRDRQLHTAATFVCRM